MAAHDPSLPSLSSSTSHGQQQHFLSCLVAGGLAGTSVDVLFFPLDTIKTRLQSRQGFRSSGGFGGMYRGLGSVITGSAPSAALFFSTYEFLKTFIPKQSQLKSDTIIHIFSACGGEIMACLIRVPTEVIKQRQQISTYGSINSAKVFSKVIQESGIRGLYTGFGVTVMREIPFCAIQFPLYERLKTIVARRQGYSSSSNLSSPWAALCGSIAGSVAAAMTTPLDVVKTRIMLSRTSLSTPSSVDDVMKRQVSFRVAARQIVNEEGWSALSKGIGPRTLWIGLGGAVFLGVYEAAKKQFPQSTVFTNEEQ